MRSLRDFEGRVIRLTDERLDHILEHPEMVGMAESLDETLAAPEQVVQSRSDASVRLYYRRYPGMRVGEKLLCVTVKVTREDAFVVTAYLTDKAKQGAVLWQGA